MGRATVLESARACKTSHGTREWVVRPYSKARVPVKQVLHAEPAVRRTAVLQTVTCIPAGSRLYRFQPKGTVQLEEDAAVQERKVRGSCFATQQ